MAEKLKFFLNKLKRKLLKKRSENITRQKINKETGNKVGKFGRLKEELKKEKIDFFIENLPKNSRKIEKISQEKVVEKKPLTMKEKIQKKKQNSGEKLEEKSPTKQRKSQKSR